MSSSRRLLLPVLLVLLAVVLGFLFLQGDSEAEPEDLVLRPDDQEVDPGIFPPAEKKPVLIVPPKVTPIPIAVGSTTVLWPLRLELDLLQAEYLPTEPGTLPVGSGATAGLQGRITGRSDRGARAEIRFIAGANVGRVLYTDATGRFGATDLYPGMSVVDVHGENLLGSRREVRLRQRRTSQLNIGYGRPGSIQGRVQRLTGEGLEGATVFIDGTRVVTGVEGGFFLGSVAAGRVLVEVECPGYTSTKEVVGITGGKMLTEKQATFTLHDSSSLVIAVSNHVGSGPVQVVLLPGLMERRPTIDDVQRNTGYPWHRINPIEVWPGRTTTIDGLPSMVVKLYAFRQGAIVPPKVVNLKSGQPYTIQLDLKPAPKITGRVTKDGEPVSGAQVSLEAPNRVRATLAYFREQSLFLESAALPDLPCAVQKVETDERGRFVLTAWADVAEVRYLEVVGPDGDWAGRLVHAGDEAIDLALEEVKLADAELELSFPDRHQALPLEILIDGTPYDPLLLPPGEPQSITDLRAGRWRMKVSWHGVPVLPEEELVIENRTRRQIELPLEAINGQDEEAWRRAGRVWPGD